MTAEADRKDAARPHRRSLIEKLRTLRHMIAARWHLRACDRIGRRVKTIGRPVVEKWQGSIEIAERVWIDSHIVPVQLAVGRGGAIRIGARTGINYGVSIGAYGEVVIGEDCLISPYVNIMDCDFHSVHDRSSFEVRPIRIGNKVWIGAKAIVLKGVSIGDNSVVSAGSVVSSDVPPNVVVAGNPARVIQKIQEPSSGAAPPGALRAQSASPHGGDEPVSRQSRSTSSPPVAPVALQPASAARSRP